MRSSPSIIEALRISQGLQAALSEGKTDDLIFFAFDLLFLESEDLRSRPLVHRKSVWDAAIYVVRSNPRMRASSRMTPSGNTASPKGGCDAVRISYR